MRSFSSGKHNFYSYFISVCLDTNILIYSTGGDRERDEGDYRGGGDDEALEDDDAALLGDDDQEGAAGSEEEADGEDLIENMEE